MQAKPDPTRRSGERQEIAALERRIAALEHDALRIDQLFHPNVALIAALLGAVLFAFASFLLFDGDRLRHYLVYNVPIAVPFVLFLFDRAQTYLQRPNRASWAAALDGVVVTLALARAVYPLPLISGHALFLSFALVTVRSRLAKLAAVLVLLIVIYFKAFVWRDPTVLGGAAVGVVAGLAWKRLDRE